MHFKVNNSNTTNSTKADGIQSGDNTHHQDQSIQLVNFKPTKSTVSNVLNHPEHLILMLLLLIVYHI